MHLRRPLALAAATALLATPALTSCGFDYGTDQLNNPAAGTNDRSGVVNVIAATIVANQSDSGTFIASLTNGSTEDTITVTGISGGDGALTARDFEPIELEPRGYANLVDGGGVVVTGDFEAGDVIPMELTFDNGEDAVLQVPVVTACEEYEGLDASGEATTDPDAEGTPSPASTETEGAEGAEGEGAYSCEYAHSEGH